MLALELPSSGAVLEVASGTGEHAVFMARRFPRILWQPSDADEEALPSIAGWIEDSGLGNIAEPLLLDAAGEDWPRQVFDAVFCANMIHITPWASARGLFAGAARCLVPDGKLILYGPFLEAGIDTAPSNREFDASLRERDPEWGLRPLDACDALASANGLVRTARHAMPANNLTLVWTRGTGKPTAGSAVGRMQP